MAKIGNIDLGEFPLLLAPMEDVSDPPFRRLCKLHGADMLYSEFISSEGLIRDAIKSRQKLDIFGSSSCGPALKKQYRLDETEWTWSFTLRPY